MTAKLMYRKIDPLLLNHMFGDSSGLTAPVTAMSEDSVTIAVRAVSE